MTLSRQAVVQLQRVLGQRRGRSAFVFARPRTKLGRISRDSLLSALSRKAEQLEVARFTAHDDRRTVASRLQDMGCPPHVLDTILDHRPRGVRQHYHHGVYAAEAREWLQRWADRLDALAARERCSVAVQIEGRQRA